MTRAKPPGSSKPRRRKGATPTAAGRPGWLPPEPPAAAAPAPRRKKAGGESAGTPAWLPPELEPLPQGGRKGKARKAGTEVAVAAGGRRGGRGGRAPQAAPVARKTRSHRGDAPRAGTRAGVLDDPNAEREAQRYENPIPSREALLAFLGEHGAPMNAEELAAALELSAPDRFFALTKRLGAMLRDGQLLVNRRGGYAVAEKLDLIAGTVIANQDGFGFLKPDAGGDDLFLPPYEMRQVLHGDRVLASVTGLDRRGRREGAIVEVLERGTMRLVGRYSERDGVGYVVPDDRRIHLDVLVPPGQAANARNNQIVVCEITQPPNRQRPPFGRVLEVLGDKLTPSLAVEVAIHGHGLPYQWPEPVLDQANGIALEVTAADRAGREDLRELPLVTIDGEDAKDFDDAVYAEVDGQGFRLVVAIADVSHYVKPGSPLDEEARLRATSVYFPGFVVPMLPEVLSNGICSLKPEVERLCFVCDMRVDRNGEVSGSRFYRAVMRSHARLTYTQVWNAIGEKDPATRAKLGVLLPHVERLHQLYRLLAKQRARRGAIEFETSEVRFVLGPGGEVVQAGMLQRNDAHMLIEECMIAANVEAARFLEKRNMPAPYRVHERPPETKYTDLLEFLREFKLRMPPWAEVEPRDYTALLKKVRTRADAALIESVLLRSQSLAVYSPQNSGHFGLALDAYAHFTSPIRRYADLLVHRAIGHALAGGRREAYVYSPHDMGQLALECSEKSRRAEEAEREVDERYRCAWMEQHVGGEFNGVVSGVTSFGLFIELVDSRVNGLVHVTQLPNDYYHFDPVRKLLSGERRGLSFRLGDPVCVLVLRASVEDRRIDFRLVAARGEPVGEGEAPPPMQDFPRGQRKRRR